MHAKQRGKAGQRGRAHEDDVLQAHVREVVGALKLLLFLAVLAVLVLVLLILAVLAAVLVKVPAAVLAAVLVVVLVMHVAVLHAQAHSTSGRVLVTVVHAQAQKDKGSIARATRFRKGTAWGRLAVPQSNTTVAAQT
jgi:hypothetical protein